MSSSPEGAGFAALMSLACHDMRTPLATVTGFVRTLPRLVETDERSARYLALIDAGAEQLGALLEDVSLAARIEGGRYEPLLTTVDSLELAQAAGARVEDGEVSVAGRGASVVVERDAAVRAVSHLARCALRHGALERVELAADGPTLTVTPVAADVAPIILGEELRDLGAAIAVRAIAAVGGSTAVEERRLVIRLPLEPIS
jgi:signal transduction histidine kinase